MFQKLDQHFRKEIELKKKMALSNGEDPFETNFNLIENPYKVAKKAVTDSLIILKELGYWCFSKAYKQLSENILDLFKPSPLFLITQEQRSKISEFLNWIEDDILRDVISKEDESNPEKILTLSSDKISGLLSVLKENKSKSSFHSIVFVQTKVSVFWLDDLLQNIALLEEWSFIKSGFIYGDNSGENKGKTMNVVRQKDVLDKFRSHEINVLVATNIIEEGVDVPACNVVIRFSRIPNFGSFVQSKVIMNYCLEFLFKIN
jgi:ERCC4-related helicase